MSSSITPLRALLLSALSIPATALVLKTYLHNNPLPASRTRTITTSDTLSTTSESAASLKIVNPKGHMANGDSRSIRLSKEETGKKSDEEILARFLKGFFGGWIFTPERKLIASLNGFSVKFIPVGYTGIEPEESTISSLSDFSQTSLPLRHTLLFGSSFMVLDYHISSPEPDSPKITDQSAPTPSFLEIGYGDNRKQFAGFHRFELSRNHNGGGEGGVTLCYSSVSCNPTIDKSPFSQWVFKFHKFYAECLFRDGIREVLSD